MPTLVPIGYYHTHWLCLQLNPSSSKFHTFFLRFILLKLQIFLIIHKVNSIATSSFFLGGKFLPYGDQKKLKIKEKFFFFKVNSKTIAKI
jgi:hypothetical protein